MTLETFETFMVSIHHTHHQGFDTLFTNEGWPVMEANAAKLAPMGKPKMVLTKMPQHKSEIIRDQRCDMA